MSFVFVPIAADFQRWILETSTKEAKDIGDENCNHNQRRNSRGYSEFLIDMFATTNPIVKMSIMWQMNIYKCVLPHQEYVWRSWHPPESGTWSDK